MSDQFVNTTDKKFLRQSKTILYQSNLKVTKDLTSESKANQSSFKFRHNLTKESKAASAQFTSGVSTKRKLPDYHEDPILHSTDNIDVEAILN